MKALTAKRKRAKAKAAYKKLPWWSKSERVIAHQLRNEGIPCNLVARQNLDWDAVSKSGLHLEFKAARLLRGRPKKHLIRCPFWVVGIARPKGRTHELRESQVDFYIIRLVSEDVKVYLVLPAPLKVKQLQVTYRQLLTKYRHDVNNFKIIVDAEKRKQNEHGS